MTRLNSLAPAGGPTLMYPAALNTEHSESFPPAAVGALMVLIGLVWLMASSGARLFGGLFFFLLLIGVLATVFTAVTRHAEQKQKPDTWMDQTTSIATAIVERTPQPSVQAPTRSTVPRQAPASPTVPLTTKVMAMLQAKPVEPEARSLLLSPARKGLPTAHPTYPEEPASRLAHRRDGFRRAERAALGGARGTTDRSAGDFRERRNHPA